VPFFLSDLASAETGLPSLPSVCSLPYKETEMTLCWAV